MTLLSGGLISKGDVFGVLWIVIERTLIDGKIQGGAILGELVIKKASLEKVFNARWQNEISNIVKFFCCFFGGGLAHELCTR